MPPTSQLPKQLDERDILRAVLNRPLFELAICELEILSCSARSQQMRRTPTLKASSTQSSASPCSNLHSKRPRPPPAKSACRSRVSGTLRGLQHSLSTHTVGQRVSGSESQLVCKTMQPHHVHIQ